MTDLPIPKGMPNLTDSDSLMGFAKPKRIVILILKVIEIEILIQIPKLIVMDSHLDSVKLTDFGILKLTDFLIPKVSDLEKLIPKLMGFVIQNEIPKHSRKMMDSAKVKVICFLI